MWRHPFAARAMPICRKCVVEAVDWNWLRGSITISAELGRVKGSSAELCVGSNSWMITMHMSWSTGHNPPTSFLSPRIQSDHIVVPAHIGLDIHRYGETFYVIGSYGIADNWSMNARVLILLKIESLLDKWLTDWFVDWSVNWLIDRLKEWLFQHKNKWK